MKKLLSILGAITLIGTATTSVVACGGEKPTPPTPDTRTDLSSLSDNAEITLSSSTETVADFKTALINKLKEDLKFKKLSDTEVDITKSDSTEIQNSDIVDSTLVTKVKAKSTSTNFNGEKNINVTITINDTRTDISTKIAKSINLGQLDINTVQDFLTKLQISLARMTDLNSITISDYDVFKAESSIAIQDSDITAGNSLNIKITAKGSKFQGVVDNITINYIQKDTRTDISTKIAKSINLGQLDINTVQDFLTKLQISLARMTDLNSITISDYDVFKAESSIAIQDSDITAGNSLNIKITAKGSKFQGVVDNITINYIQKDTRTDISTKIAKSINLGQLDINTVQDFLTKLQISLARMTDLNSITISDYDVFKAESSIAIQDSDITAGNSLNIKITAKGSKFQGVVDNITINYIQKDTRTDISTKIAKSINLGQLDINTVQDFLTKLQISLARMTDLNSITISDYDVFKAESSIAIQDSDITAGNSLNIKITAKGSKFQGVVDNITINYIQKDTRTDLSTIITNKELNIIGINPEVNPTSEIIKNKTKSKNLDLDINAISVSSITSTSATIIGNGKYKGNVIVKYTIDKTKTDLSMITKLTGLNINADSSSINFILWEKIKLANEFVDKQEIFDKWAITFYDNSGNVINDKMQKHGDLYCIIFAKEKNSKWIGQTSKLKFTLK